MDAACAAANADASAGYQEALGQSEGLGPRGGARVSNAREEVLFVSAY